MVRTFFIFVIMYGFLFSAYSAAIAQENLTALIKKVEPSTVLILTYDKSGKTLLQGSGFFVNRDGDVITNDHVMKGAARAEIKTFNGKTFPVRAIIAEDKEGDLIRISTGVPPGSSQPLTVRHSLPEAGERIVVIGNPLGLTQTVSEGIVSAVRKIPDYGNIIQTIRGIGYRIVDQ